MAKKACELCSNPARMFCESDQASLCWDCDEKVHAANFLVAKHSRTLLCHVCHSPTAWKAAGPRLGPTVSVCHACSGRASSAPDPRDRGEGVSDNSQESESDDGEYYSESDSDDYGEDEEEEEEDGENQVVPWTAEVNSTAASSSTSEEEENTRGLKRNRNYPFESEDEDGCCSSPKQDSKTSDGLSYQLESDNENNNGCDSSSLLRPLKMRRTSNHHGAFVLQEPVQEGEEAPFKSSLMGTAGIVEKLRRLQHQIVSEEEGEESAAAIILGICKLTRDS